MDRRRPCSVRRHERRPARHALFSFTVQHRGIARRPPTLPRRHLGPRLGLLGGRSRWPVRRHRRARRAVVHRPVHPLCRNRLALSSRVLGPRPCLCRRPPGRRLRAHRPPPARTRFIHRRPNLKSRALMERLGFTRDLAGDFLHPKLPDGHPLQLHVLYRKRLSSPALASLAPADPSSSFS